MCDRLYVYAEDLWAWLDDNLEDLDEDFSWPLDNWHVEDEDVLPGQTLLGLCPLENRLTGVVMTWGVAPPWQPNQPPQLTVDAEAITQDDAGREWFAQGRCLLLATAYYPSEAAAGSTGARNRVRLASGWAMPLAGLWASGAEQSISCALVTCAAGDDRRGTNPRQPVIIPSEHVGRWLDSEIADIAALRDLLRPLVPGALMTERADSLEDASEPAPTSGPQPA